MFQSVETVARITGISEDSIDKYVSQGWIATVTREGTTFLPDKFEPPRALAARPPNAACPAVK